MLRIDLNNYLGQHCYMHRKRINTLCFAYSTQKMGTKYLQCIFVSLR